MHVDTYSYIRYGAGVEMTVHASNTWPLTSEYGFVLAPGLSHYVATTYEEISRLSVPYAKEECISQTERPNYNYEKCLTDCTWEVAFANCSCGRNIMMECTNAKIIEEDCYNRNRRQLVEAKCAHCKRNCEEIRYNVVTSSAMFPAKNHIAELLRQTGLNRTDEGDIRDNVMLVKIYLSTLNYVQRRHRKSFDQSTLVANIGGFLGLFMGASVITICEVFEILLHLICVGIRRAINRKRACTNSEQRHQKSVSKTDDTN